jgi:hypothetical protein
LHLYCKLAVNIHFKVRSYRRIKFIGNGIENTIKDTELLRQFKEVDNLPDHLKNSLLEVIKAFTRETLKIDSLILYKTPTAIAVGPFLLLTDYKSAKSGLFLSVCLSTLCLVLK